MAKWLITSRYIDMTISMSSTDIWRSLPLLFISDQLGLVRPVCCHQLLRQESVNVRVGHRGMRGQYAGTFRWASTLDYLLILSAESLSLQNSVRSMRSLVVSCSLNPSTPKSDRSKNSVHSMKNLAFHSLLRWKMIVVPILTTSCIHFSLRRLGECTFWTWEWKP